MSSLWAELVADTARPAYHFGTRRAVGPADTLRRITPMLAGAGITRLADVTGLDWIGIPVYQATRPNSRNLSVAQGKGLTRVQAKVSALMESLESFHAECIDQPVERATLGVMRQQLAYDPYALPVVQTPSVGARDLSYDSYAPPIGAPTRLRDHTPLDWVAATDLVTGSATWVPRQLCQLDFTLQERLAEPLFRATSNGLASGNTVAEALIHGLCEVVERDGLWRLHSPSHQPEPSIDQAGVPSRLAQQVLQRFARAGMRADIVDATGPTLLPTFEVLLRHAESPATYHGSGCHPSRTTALLRALTEAAQSRLSHIAGSRDDFFRRSYTAGAEVSLNARLPADSAQRRFQEIPSLLPGLGLGATVHEIVARVRSVTGMSPLAVDLRRSAFGLPVVFVVAPGLRLAPPSRR
ncbi:MAG TPA: YcaO-like family protein [Chloroflexota bacterium]|nr:YcaO-like family protein [Chloroflexota bacterium]